MEVSSFSWISDRVTKVEFDVLIDQYFSNNILRRHSNYGLAVLCFIDRLSPND